MTENAPQIQIGKKPGEHFNVGHMLPLPADTPFGNLALKHLRIIERLDRVNLMVQRIFSGFEGSRTNDLSGDLLEHSFLSEQVIYWLRKTADELIGLLHVLAERETTGQYPTRVAPDSIGRLLGKKSIPAPFADHADFLATLNEMANAYKHSFINSDISLVGRDEPLVFALALRHNDLSNAAAFYSVSVRDVVSRFNAFFTAVDTELRKCKLPHLTHP